MNSARTGFVLCWAALALAGGCSLRADWSDVPPEHATVVHDSLQVHVGAEPQIAQVGDTIHLTVVARNLSRKPIAIRSATAAPVIATLWRHDAATGWVRVKEFPTAAVRLPGNWELRGHDERTFDFALPVEADWPVLTSMKLSAELNGRPDARPHVFVYVQPR